MGHEKFYSKSINLNSVGYLDLEIITFNELNQGSLMDTFVNIENESKSIIQNDEINLRSKSSLNLQDLVIKNVTLNP